MVQVVVCEEMHKSGFNEFKSHIFLLLGEAPGLAPGGGRKLAKDP
jgi:hypothetical protein